MGTVPASPRHCQPLIDPLLPAHSVHLLAGASGAGKTTLAAQMLRWLHDGAPVFGYPSRPPAGFAVITADRGWNANVHWFRAVGLADIPHYSFHDDMSFRWERLAQPRLWLPTLKAALDGTLCGRPGWIPPDSLVLIDPLTGFLGGNLMDYHQVFRALGELDQYCLRHRLTVLGTAHAGKQRAKELQYVRPQDRVLGTTALLGCTETVFYLATLQEASEPYSELFWMPRLAPQGSVRLIRSADTGLFEVSTEQSKEERAAARHEEKLKEFLDLFVEPEGTPIGVLLKRALKTGLSPATVYRRICELAGDGRILNVRRGVWKRVQPN
jgi:hypothetical protein